MPRNPESIRDRVRHLVESLPEGESPPSIPQMADLLEFTPRQISHVVRKIGPIRGLNDNDTEQHRSQAMKYRYHSPWSRVGVYARDLYMTGTQGHFALLFEQGEDISSEKLNLLFNGQRRRANNREEQGLWQEGEIRDLTEEEKAYVRRHQAAHPSQGQEDQLARLRVNALRIIQEQRLPVPDGLLEWVEVETFLASKRGQLVEAEGQSIYDTHVRQLLINSRQQAAMVLIDWMEEVDFHQIGQRRLIDPRYVAVMLYRQNVYLQKTGIDLTAPVARGRLQVPGASLPRGLFAKIEDIGQMTDKVLIETGQEADDDHLGVVPIKRVLRYVDYLKFCTYYLTYLKRHPEAISVENPLILKSRLQQLLKDPQTAQAIKGWAINLRRLMDQGRRQGLSIN